MKLRWKIAQAAEIRWWQNYLAAKPKSEYLSWKRSYWHSFLERIGIALQKNQFVLDAGCGPAGIFMVLEAQQVFALDPLLEQYEEKLPHFDMADYPHVCFMEKPLEDLEDEQSYDVVFCLNAINHVQDISLCFDRLVRASKRGGMLVVSIDAHKWALLRRVFQVVPGDLLHPHQYMLEEYCRFLEDRGCSILKTVEMKKGFLFDYYVLVAEVL